MSALQGAALYLVQKDEKIVELEKSSFNQLPTS
jgi:hypothetical protein